MLPSDEHVSVPNIIKLISENTENVFIVLSSVVQVHEQITHFSLYSIFRKCPNFYGN